MMKLLILYGGISEERDVSVKSAREVMRNLDPNKYEPVCVFIGRDGQWRLSGGPDGEPDGAPVSLSTDRDHKGLIVLTDGQYRIIPVDVAFAVLHGQYGEDGTVQGMLKTAGIPYVGCGVYASALAMDKALTYLVAAQAGVHVPRHKVLMDGSDGAAGDLSYPLFVKPARSGSSFGVSKVTDAASLPKAIYEARRYGGKVLIEEAVPGHEIGCAVMGNGANLMTGALDQIDLSGGFFRIHQEEKPEEGSENATFRVPAPVPDAVRDRIIETARTVYRALGCRGLARVDMFLTPRGQVVLNEVNTMPGLTSYSRYPRMMAGAGIPLRAVIDHLVALALEDGGADA